MSLFCRLSRRHYWCTPHRSAENRLVQVCYECGAERPARELHAETGIDLKSQLQAISKPEVTRRAVPRLVPEAPKAAKSTAERLALAQGRTGRLLVVK
jgi:predicted ATPase